MEMISASW